ncbi:MAG TPA: hypothetical protein VGR97_14780 [Candidatus Acidoferrales bacterium]|nr:hypothetical protein [Candidatus Acidoferrales bacterium]
MVLQKGQIYRCQNLQCHAEMQIVKDSVEGESNPKCCCGAEMKKLWNTPVLRRLQPTPEVLGFFSGKR